MKINVQDLLSDKLQSKHIELEVPFNSFEFEGNEFIVNRPVKITGELVKATEGIYFKGNLYAELKTQCSRCLEDVLYNLTVDFDEFYSSMSDDADYKIIENNIDIQRLIEDNIIMNVPLKPLCDEYCKGLCPICGTNLNKSNCACDNQVIDPRLEKLKNFFNRD